MTTCYTVTTAEIDTMDPRLWLMTGLLVVDTYVHA